MHHMGIFTGAQLREVSLSHLVDMFGKAGPVYYSFARGIDEREVVVEHERKSVGCEQTFLEDISLKSKLLIELYHMVLELEERIAHAQFEGKTLTLKVKYHDFTQITRSTTVHRPLKTKAEILPLAKRLLSQVEYHAERRIRLLGVSVSKSNSSDDEFIPRWEEGWLPFEDY